MLNEKIYQSLESVPQNRAINERSEPRIQVTGTAHVGCANQQTLKGKLFDLTSAGTSIFLDVQLPSKELYSLHLSVYHKGVVHTINAQGRCTYAMLVGSKGFRHGFQFQSLDQQLRDKLKAICA